MRLSVRRSLPALFLAGLGLGLWSCGESLGPNGEQLVTVENNDFDPGSKAISVGQTVLWQWAAGSAGHNVTWVNQSGTGNSATQSTGTYSRTFDTAGTYDYYCTIHGLSMSGSVVVH